MKSFIFLVFPILLINTCQKEETIEDITWTIGADHSTDTTIVVTDLPSNLQVLSCDNYSICPNTNLKLSVTSGSQVIIDSVFSEAFQDLEINGMKNKTISIQSSLVQGDSLILCVWQGQAVFSFH